MRYPLDSDAYPKNIHLTALGTNFPLFTWAYAGHPNILKLE